MLNITRRIGEQVRFVLPDGRSTTVLALPARPGYVRLGIEAPDDVQILREEIYQLRRGEQPERGPAA